MAIKYVGRTNGRITSSYDEAQPGAGEMIDDGSAEYKAFLAPPAVGIDVIMTRLEAEGVWNAYVNYMFGADARRNEFVKRFIIGYPIPVADVPFRNSLFGAGLYAAQVDRIMMWP